MKRYVYFKLLPTMLYIFSEYGILIAHSPTFIFILIPDYCGVVPQTIPLNTGSRSDKVSKTVDVMFFLALV